MNNKKIVSVLSVLLVICCACAIIGFLNKKETPVVPNTPTPVKKEVVYEYYLEDELIESMPINDDDGSYEFSKYICDNNMIINFNTDTWSFTTENEENGKCQLYFVRGKYEVTLTATNGLIDGTDASKVFKVTRLQDESFSVVPNEGYEFKSSSCANDKEALYDKSTNTLTITSISSDIACKIDFEKKNFKVDVNVKNGKGTTSEYKNYGETFTAVITPDEGFEKPKITCTNKQEFTFENNKLTIQKLTNDTQCNVTFSKTQPVTYNLSINNIPQQVTITAGNKRQTIVAGKDGKFSIRVEEGYEVNLDCNGVKPSDVQIEPDGVITYTFLGINKNITCNIVITPIEGYNGQ